MYLRTRHHFSRRPTHHSLHFVHIFYTFRLVLVKFSSYFPFCSYVVVPGIPGLRAVPDLVTIHPILPPTVHIHP